MVKELKCRDIGIACDQAIRANTEEELIKKTVQHALMVHGIDLTEPDLLEQLRALIGAINPPR